MTMKHIFLNVTLMLLLAIAFAAAPAKAADLPNVVILATGGTIAGAQPSEGDPGYKSGAVSVEALIGAAPGLDKLANITGEQLASIGSQDMNDEVWLKLADRANKLLADPKIAGIVVTHGTDTAEETAYFLNLVVKSDKPVVLVGSMRPSTSTSPDGPLNLYNAVAVAADPIAKGLGVLVVSNDDLFAAREIQKSSTTDLQTFISPNRGNLGEAYYGKTWLFGKPINRHTVNSQFTVGPTTKLPRVDIVYAHEGVDGTMVEAARAAGAKGIVLAAVGDGNATREMIDALAAAADNGVVVVRSTRVGSGIVRRNIEVNDDELGFVASYELNPQKARILLRLALLETSSPSAIQRMFAEY
jgi:L-asparaginase